MAAETYLDFAEEDYKFFSATYNDGYRASNQGVMAQNICERYLKHIIDKYMEPVNDVEEAGKSNILRAHSLKRLIRYITDTMNIDIPSDTRNAMNSIDGFYYSMRYPGDDSYFASPEDIENAHAAVELTRNFVLEQIAEIEKNSSI